MASSALKRLLQWIPLLTISKDWQDIGFVPKMEISPVVRTAWGATKGCSSGCFVGLGMGFSPWCGSYSLQQTRVSFWYLLLPRLLLELLFCKFPSPKSLLWPRPLRSRQTAWSTPGQHERRIRDTIWETECERDREVAGVAGGSSLSLEEGKTIPMAWFLLLGYIPWCLSAGVLLPWSDCFTLRSETNPALTSCVLLQHFCCCSTTWRWGYQHHTHTPSSHVDLLIHLPEGIWRSSSLGCSHTPVPPLQEKAQHKSPWLMPLS